MKLLIKLVSKSASYSGLRSNLLHLGIDETVTTAITYAVQAGLKSSNPQAKAYAGAIEESFEYGLSGVRMQLSYLLLNLSDWRGDSATICKSVIRRWLHKADR